jgi:hypothetical protein
MALGTNWAEFAALLLPFALLDFEVTEMGTP